LELHIDGESPQRGSEVVLKTPASLTLWDLAWINTFRRIAGCRCVLLLLLARDHYSRDPMKLWKPTTVLLVVSVYTRKFQLRDS
jgi:hypothetical protein